MKWIEARHLVAWADRLDARVRLPEIVSQLVRASAASISAYRFPEKDNAQLPGYDGRLTAIPGEPYRAFLPEGDSVWEWGTNEDYRAKANGDYTARTKKPEPVDPASTTFEFVTPRIWHRTDPSAEGWAADKRAEGIWKDVKVLDAIQLEHWLELCPAVAASVAREIIGHLPQTGAIGSDEFWREYASQFQPTLREEVLLAGREEQAKLVIRALMGGAEVHRWQGDSLAEVLAFVIAAVRRADPEARSFIESRMLLVETKEAARALVDSPHLVFAVRGEAVELAGRLAESHPVIVPLGRESLVDRATTRLARPPAHELGSALKTMGFDDNRAIGLARECGRSITILARRIPSAVAKRPSWDNKPVLIPALLAGAWDSAFEGDQAAVERLAGEEYTKCEAVLREFLRSEDGPLEREGTVWAVRAPVDVFAHIARLLGPEHLIALEQVAGEAFGEVDPALALKPEDRPFAQLRGIRRTHSTWLREGLATTLLMIAALGEESGMQLAGRTAKQIVDRIVNNIPGLRDDPRVMASLANELPLLMEAAPDPLLAALEHLLRGDGMAMRQIFQDAPGRSALFMHSPHTGLLWALELIAWDPTYLAPAAAILAKLSEVDPGGALKNRPIESLRHIFLSWRPSTNASLHRRITVLDQITTQHPAVGWKLLVLLLPKRPDYGSDGMRPRFREANASEREARTDALILETYHEIVVRAVRLAGTDPRRWEAILDGLHAFPRNEIAAVVGQLEAVAANVPQQDRVSLWQVVNHIVRHHRAHPGKAWTLPDGELDRLEQILEKVSPNDPIQESLWLFEKRSPSIQFTSVEQFDAEVEEMRRTAVRRVWETLGDQGVVDLAAAVELPRFVGFSFGHVVDGPAKGLEVAVSAFARGDRLNEFVTFLSMALLGRFGVQWQEVIASSQKTHGLTAKQIASFLLAWPHNRPTWTYVESLGADVAREFWQSKMAWGLQGDNNDVEYAIERYLDAERAEYVVEALYPKMRDVSTALILQTLDQFYARLAESTKPVKAQAIDFDLQEIFAVLGERKDVPLIEIGKREYRYLPLLRESFAVREPHPSLVLDQLMGENPEFYVSVLCDVYRSATDKDKDLPVSEEERTRARFGATLLDGFEKIPGFSAHPPDKTTLEAWVSEVRRYATDRDRLVMAEEYIGKLVAHGPSDPHDGHWPHVVIRECLEDWRAKHIEHGMATEKFNMRGGGARDPKAGGAPEHHLAAEIREASKLLVEWPRAQAVLEDLARMWEQMAKALDLRAKQDELRDT
jgi:hypothetical protein